jgi:hypothetical protein
MTWVGPLVATSVHTRASIKAMQEFTILSELPAPRVNTRPDGTTLAVADWGDRHLELVMSPGLRSVRYTKSSPSGFEYGADSNNAAQAVRNLARWLIEG